METTCARPSISAAASATSTSRLVDLKRIRVAVPAVIALSIMPPSKADPGAPHPVLRASSLQMPPKKAAIAAAASKSAKKKKWSKGKVKDKVGLRTSSRLILECDLLTLELCLILGDE